MKLRIMVRASLTINVHTPGCNMIVWYIVDDDNLAMTSLFLKIT